MMCCQLTCKHAQQRTLGAHTPRRPCGSAARAAPAQMVGHLEQQGHRLERPSIRGHWDGELIADMPDGSARTIFSKNHPPPSRPNRPAHLTSRHAWHASCLNIFRTSCDVPAGVFLGGKDGFPACLHLWSLSLADKKAKEMAACCRCLLQVQAEPVQPAAERAAGAAQKDATAERHALALGPARCGGGALR